MCLSCWKVSKNFESRSCNISLRNFSLFFTFLLLFSTNYILSCCKVSKKITCYRRSWNTSLHMLGTQIRAKWTIWPKRRFFYIFNSSHFCLPIVSCHAAIFLQKNPLERILRYYSWIIFAKNWSIIAHLPQNRTWREISQYIFCILIKLYDAVISKKILRPYLEILASEIWGKTQAYTSNSLKRKYFG